LINSVLSPGMHRVMFDASNLASGLYFYKLIAGNFVQIKRMLYLQ